MIRTYKRKLKLTVAQQERIISWIGCCRLVYNMALEISTTAYRATGKRPHKYELMKQLKDIRAEYSWMEDVSRECLDSSIKRLDASFLKFYKTAKRGGGYPKFQNKKRFKTIDFKTIEIRDGKVWLPKLGKLNIYKDSQIKGTLTTAKITINPTGFFITIQCKDVPPKFVSEKQAIGIDMGISFFCVDSNGSFVENPTHFKKYERRLRNENRSLARKRKGSVNWWKQVKKLNMLHHKITNVRKDFLHKESTRIAKSNTEVYLEDLRINNMVKNPLLSKHIMDAGWGLFKKMLSYKTNVILVNPKHTSQQCNDCGFIESGNRLNQSEFICKSCGNVSNADHNAALNILSRGTAISRKREALA